MSKLPFRTGFEPDYKSSDYGLYFGDDAESVSLTHQSFKDEADINFILNRMAAVGMLPSDVPASGGSYMDLADAPDYHTAMNLIIDAQEAFDGLPANVRKRFDNDPASFLAFVHDEKNLDEMQALGLLNVSPDMGGSVTSEPVGTPST